jgi:hypothetical protein
MPVDGLCTAIERASYVTRLTDRAAKFLLTSGSSFVTFQPWMSDMISGLIRAGFYQAIPDADTNYQILLLTPLGRRAVESIKQAELGLAPENVISLPELPAERRGEEVSAERLRGGRIDRKTSNRLARHGLAKTR